jgi:hypothetical protein
MAAHCVAGERHRSGKMKPVRYCHNYGIPGDDCGFVDLQAQLALRNFARSRISVISGAVAALFD